MLTRRASRRQAERKKAKLEGWERKHLRWIRGFDCAVLHKDPYGCSDKVIAHHVREGSHAGASRKPPDDRTVPLCTNHHTWLHGHGEKQFERRHGVDLVELAAKLAALSPAIRKWKAEKRGSDG